MREPHARTTTCRAALTRADTGAGPESPPPLRHSRDHGFSTGQSFRSDSRRRSTQTDQAFRSRRSMSLCTALPKMAIGRADRRARIPVRVLVQFLAQVVDAGFGHADIGAQPRAQRVERDTSPCRGRPTDDPTRPARSAAWAGRTPPSTARAGREQAGTCRLPLLQNGVRTPIFTWGTVVGDTRRANAARSAGGTRSLCGRLVASHSSVGP